mgnify:CR=1 FL=1
MKLTTREPTREGGKGAIIADCDPMGFCAIFSGMGHPMVGLCPLGFHGIKLDRLNGLGSQALFLFQRGQKTVLLFLAPPYLGDGQMAVIVEANPPADAVSLVCILTFVLIEEAEAFDWDRIEVIGQIDRLEKPAVRRCGFGVTA